MPGVHINLSKSGISSTIGPRGANINVGQRGTYLNTGIPGTGLSQRTKIGNRKPATKDDIDNEFLDAIGMEELATQIQSNPESLTSDSMKEVETYVVNIGSKRNKTKQKFTQYLNWRNYLGIGGFVGLVLSVVDESFILLFVLGPLAIALSVYLHTRLKPLKQLLKDLVVPLDIDMDDELLKQYGVLLESFKGVCNSQFVWDHLSFNSVQKRERSAASQSVKRKKVIPKISDLDFIESEIRPMFIPNANGGDMYFYPAFILMNYPKPRIVSYADLDVIYDECKFIEEETIPKDAEQVSTTWFKINKNGNPDKRFKGNYQIPVMLYGQINLKTSTGMDEEYVMSNANAAEVFATELNSFVTLHK